MTNHDPANPKPSRGAGWNLWLVLALQGASQISQAGESFSPASINQGQLYLSSSNIGGHPHLTGLNINLLLGADRFYEAGYTGTRAIQANIEAEHIWEGHETLGHALTRVTGTRALGSTAAHPTSVGQALGGRASGNHPGQYFELGLAPGAALWSGSIATAINHDDNSFNFTDESLASVYSAVLAIGVGNQTADVFNSSWGYPDPAGFNTPAMGVAGLLYQTGKTGVAAAGNGGPLYNSVGGLAAGYNTIAVAALGSDTDPLPYNMPSNFSSRGPNDYYDPGSGENVPEARARIDIAAPGQDLTLAIPVPGDKTGNDWYLSHQVGTSFAAPLVAGGASLVVDAGKALYAADAQAIDGRVVKAVLLNGADKTERWDNGQQDSGGTITTTQALDYASGAGRMNLARTYEQYVDPLHGGQAGTTNIMNQDCFTSGACPLGDVATTGWDFGWSNEGGQNRYFLGEPLAAGQTLTVTLTWFADIDPGSPTDFAGTQQNHLANLDLRVFSFDPLTHDVLGTTAQSISLYNQTEHLALSLGAPGFYGLEVAHAGDLWNFNGATGEFYGLAWSIAATPVPLPAAAWLFMAGLTPLLRWRERKPKIV